MILIPDLQWSEFDSLAISINSSLVDKIYSLGNINEFYVDFYSLLGICYNYYYYWPKERGVLGFLDYGILLIGIVN